MNTFADVSARTSRAALLLFSLFALSAFGQGVVNTPTPVVPTPPVSPVSGVTAAPTQAQNIIAAVQPAQTVTVTPPATPLVTPPSTLTPTGNALQAPSTGETALTLDVGNGIRAVPAARVTVPVGETLLVTGPNPSGRSVQWFKNGRAIPGATGNLFAIQSVTSADAGIYYVMVIDSASPNIPSQSLVLGVGPTDRLLNLSTRATLAAGADQNLTCGFVVAAAASQSKKLILRAVGPTLASFGVSGALRAPVLRVFDSAGNLYTNGYAYPAVVGGPTYETDLADSLAKTGAFPIAPGTLDAVVMMPFVAGAYTAQVTSGDRTAGTVLLEVYEVP